MAHQSIGRIGNAFETKIAAVTLAINLHAQPPELSPTHQNMPSEPFIAIGRLVVSGAPLGP
jgi:hypothetical protein